MVIKDNLLNKFKFLLFILNDINSGIININPELNNKNPKYPKNLIMKANANSNLIKDKYLFKYKFIIELLKKKNQIIKGMSIKTINNKYFKLNFLFNIYINVKIIIKDIKINPWILVANANPENKIAKK